MRTMPSISIDVVTTVVYGTTATIIGLVTIYQAYIAWRLWLEHHHNSGHLPQGVHETSLSPLAPKDKLCLLLRIDVELALGSAIAVQQAPSSIATVDVVPTQDMNDVQAFANQVTASVSPRPLGPSASSTADPESVESTNESQAAASPGIAPNAAFALPLQPLQPPEPPDVVPVQDTISTHGVANPADLSVSYPTLNPPEVPASSGAPVHSSDGS